MIKRAFSYAIISCFILVLSSCEDEEIPDNGCEGIEEIRSEVWAKNEGNPIDISDMLDTYKGADGNDYIRCRFFLECKDVCPDNPVQVEIIYQYENKFPDGSDYGITDLKLESFFWEYGWDSENSKIRTNKNTIPMSFQSAGNGSAGGEYQVSGPYKEGQVYAQVAASVDFIFRIQNPEEPDIPEEILGDIISKVGISIEYSR